MNTPCKTMRHCADHGWCHRCEPRFAALMSEINHVIQHSGAQEEVWGPLYAEIGRILHGSGGQAEMPAEIAEARATNKRLNLRVQAMEKENATYQRAVAEWQVEEKGTYIPARTLQDIGRAAGKDVYGTTRHIRYFERIEAAEAAIDGLRKVAGKWNTNRLPKEAEPLLMEVLLVLTEAGTEAEEGMLPPFSGEAALCAKCGNTGAGTAYKAAGEPPENGVHAMCDQWPERLERECSRCEYRWDEDLNPPA